MSPRTEPPAPSSPLELPVRSGEEELIEAVAMERGVELPSDFISAVGAYGDVLICDTPVQLSGSKNGRSGAKWREHTVTSSPLR